MGEVQASPFLCHMKTLIFLFTFLPLLGLSQYNLVWSDEFEGNTLNSNNWVHEIGNGNWGWGNNELQYYTDAQSNIFVDTGYLHIVAREESISGYNYTSARIKTQTLQNFTYGKIETRLKVPVDQGLWPAFWMLGENITSVGWPKCGEIDIMEHVNNELQIHGTIHFDMWGHTYKGDKEFTDASQFHVYAIEWDENNIKWFLDGVQFHSEYIGETSVSREEFHTPFFLLLNLAIGGNWPGSPDATTSFPATMMVDYVRVYQKTNEVIEIPKPSFTIYPNPVKSALAVDTKNNFAEYQILSLNGRLLQEGTYHASIDVSELAVGAYLLQLTDSTGIGVTEMFLVE